MGQRMRALNWPATPLGPVAAWPQSLKTCIRIILTSRQPMFVWWGPELINLYNDAYRAIAGGKHPAALGQPARVVWREIWDQVGSRAGAAMRANEGTHDESLLLIMERNGYQEETYYTFSYSPVPDDRGGAGGIICANTDDTRRIIGERQLALLRELATRLSDARSVQVVIEVASIVLGINPRDLPFSALYLLSADRQELLRAGCAGIGPEHTAIPERVSVKSPLGVRMLDALECRDTCVIGAEPGLVLPGGAWSSPPRQIAYVPIAPPSETGRLGILIVGLSPFRLFDAGYQGFLELIAGQISAALASAQVHEDERWSGDAVSPELPSAVPTRILVVEDDADMRAYITRLLRKVGWSVETASGGPGALASLRDRRADVVISGVTMPDLDGLAVLRAVRGDPALADVAVILLSAQAGEELRIAGLTHGANDYLVKPFSARELIARVQTQAVSVHLRRLEYETRRRLSSLFSHAPVGIALLRGPEHVYELCNPSYLQLVNGRPIVGKPVREALPELAGQGIFELLDRVYATGEPYSARGLTVCVECARTGKLEELYFDFVCQPMPEADGTIGGVLVVVLDVTDQVQARRRESAARTEAERANRAKDEFLAMLGHELRNPLAPILTAVELMRLHAPTSVQREVTVIERQAQHLVRLVEDLLDVSRITRGKLELKKERIELSRVVARAIEQASPIIEQRKHDLTVNVSASGLALDADPDRLAQVIANLLTNAAKYTETGGQITVTAVRTPEQMIEIKVRDTGIGIAPEMLPAVFDRFVQERQALDRSLGGLGLGLAIVRSIVMLHGGSVSAHSAGRGQGAEFTIVLPALDPRTVPAAPQPIPPVVREPHRSGLRILLVDDNEDYADMLGAALAAKGNRLRIANDGPTALRIANEFAPQIAILDIGLPVMDGYELAQLLRGQPGREALRLVAMTGYGQEGDKRRARAAGFDAHLVKPVNAEHVESVIRDLISAPPGISARPGPHLPNPG